MKKMPIVAMGFLATMLSSQTRADESEITRILGEEASSWNAGDAHGYSRHFSAGGTFTNILGMFFTGRQAFQDKHEEIFRGIYKGTTLEQKIASIRYIRPDVAIVETLASVSGFSKAGLPAGIRIDESGCLRVRLLQVFVKNSDGWEIATYHNVDLKPTASHSEPRR